VEKNQMKNMPSPHLNRTFLAMNLVVKVALFAAAATVLSSCSTAPNAQDGLAAIKGSFAERGVAKLDRLEQTEIQKICSEANASGQELPKASRERMEKTLYDSIAYPADGQYIGDWKEGEKIAQNGRGLQFSDAAGVPGGANCYACHQISPSEISYGNQGPSLLKYGSIRGVKDPASKDAEAIVKYTWARIWNTHSINLCSNMPRFGDAGILTPAQIKDVMALLLSPESPVNK
jgi:L-cysteine S-thiosulfotransferase